MESASAQRKRLMLLVLVAAYNNGRGVSRDRAMGLLWPESDEPRARNSLNQALHGLRRLLGEDAIFGAQDLRLSTALVSCDVTDLWSARDAGDLPGVVVANTGAFLDGVFISGASELNTWIEQTRSSVNIVYREAL